MGNVTGRSTGPPAVAARLRQLGEQSSMLSLTLYERGFGAAGAAVEMAAEVFDEALLRLPAGTGEHEHPQ